MATQFQHDCPHCSTRSAGFRMVYGWRGGDAPDYRNFLGICGVCSQGVIVRSYDNHAEIHKDLAQESDSFPSDRFEIVMQWPENYLRPPPHVPQNVAGFYLQGLENLRAKRWDAAGAMFRKSLDVATKILDPAVKNITLFKRIENLSSQGLITDSMKDWSHEIRLDGNEAVHGEDPETEDDATVTQQFTEAFLRYTFSLPSMVSENRTKRTT